MYLGNWPPKTDQLSALRPWTLAVVTSEYLDQFLAGLDGTVTIVIDKVETGLWEQTRPIVILLDSLDSVDVLLNNKYFARHANILIMAPSASPTILQAARQDIPIYSDLLMLGKKINFMSSENRHLRVARCLVSTADINQ